MILVLGATTSKITAKMDGSGTSSEFVATYADATSTAFTEGASGGAMNGTSDVDIVAAPASSTTRIIKSLTFTNLEGSTKIFTVEYDFNGTKRTICKQTVADGKTLVIDEAGINVTDDAVLRPSFRAYRSANVTITGTSYSKMSINSVSWDTHGWYDNVTNFRYTPLKAGKYQVNVMAFVNAVADTFVVAAAIYKNGSRHVVGSYVTQEGASDHGSACGGIVSMNGTTDYIEMYVAKTDSTDRSLYGGEDLSHFSAVWVGE